MGVEEDQNDSLNCVVCLELAIDAMECRECACIMCKKCTTSMTSCPLCRKTGTIKDSAFARKMINNFPSSCLDCGYKATISDLKYHKIKCEKRTYTCSIPKCGFSSLKSDILNHYALAHESYLIEEFDKNEVKPNSNKFNMVWENNTKIYKMLCPSFLYTVTSKEIMNNTGSEYYNVIIRMDKITSSGHICIGFSNRRLCIAKGFLGGDLGSGNWGLAGNGALGESGKWVKGEAFKQGDKVTLTLRNQEISYRINDKENYYKFKFPYPQVYLAATFYYENDSVTIIS